MLQHNCPQSYNIYNNTVHAASYKSLWSDSTNAGWHRWHVVLATPMQNLKQHYHWYIIFWKSKKTLGKVPEKTKSNLPSIYMVVTFLENSRNVLCLFVSQEQVLGTDNYKLVFHPHECPLEHFKVTASSSSFCTCCRMSGCLASLAHIPLGQLGTQLAWQSKLSAHFPNVP